MKKFYFLFMVLVLCCLSFALSHVVPKKLNPSEKLVVCAEEVEASGEKTQILISGYATKRLHADSAIVFAYFENESEQLSSNTNLQYDVMVENLYETGIKDEDVFLYNFDSFPMYKEDGEKMFLNCYNFNIMVKDLQNLNQVFDVLSFCKAEIQDVKYQVSNINEEYSQVLNKAIEDAKNRAGEILKDDFELVNVKEKSVLYSSTLSESDLDNAQVTIEIHAKVEAVFE